MCLIATEFRGDRVRIWWHHKLAALMCQFMCSWCSVQYRAVLCLLVAGYLEINLKTEQVVSNECRLPRKHAFVRLSSSFFVRLGTRLWAGIQKMLNSSSCFCFTIIEGPGYHILRWFQICKFQGGLKPCVPSGDMVHPSLVTWMWTVFMTGVSSRVPSTKSAAVSPCEHQKLSNFSRMHTQVLNLTNT